MIETLVKVNQRAAELLYQHGLYDWRFEVSNTKNFVGRCLYTPKIIEVSKYYLTSSWEEIEDTLLHEIAHALVGHEAGHGPIWKAKAREIGARPERVTETAVFAGTHNYVLKCPTCKKEWKRHRLRKIHHNSKCPDCKIKIDVYKVVRK